MVQGYEFRVQGVWFEVARNFVHVIEREGQSETKREKERGREEERERGREGERER